MAITDESRFHLYQRLEAVLGSQEAKTLMEHLPPVGWADVATKTDLAHLEHSLRQEFQLGLAEVRIEIHASSNRLLVTLLAANLVFVSLVLIVARVG